MSIRRLIEDLKKVALIIGDDAPVEVGGRPALCARNDAGRCVIECDEAPPAEPPTMEMNADGGR